MREKPKDKVRLQHIVDAIDTIFEFVGGVSKEHFLNNKMMQFAIIKNLEIIGEAAYLLTKDLKQNHSEVEWKDIEGMRHFLVHEYYQISNEIIWETIENELESLKTKVNIIISEITD